MNGRPTCDGSPEGRSGAAVPPPGARSGPWSERHFVTLLITICIVGGIARAVILTEYVRHNPLAGWPVNDAETYWRWAGEIAAEQTRSDGAPFLSAPLYPYLLGGLRAVGAGLTAAYVAQAMLTVLTALVLAVVARRRFGAATGLLAAGLFLFSQETASSALRVLDSTLHLALVTLLWAALVAVQQRATWERCLGAGVVLGLLCLSYAPALGLVPVLAAWIWLSGRHARGTAGRAFAAAATSLLVVSPATLHNYRATGELILIRGGAGVTLAQGNQPGSRGVYTPLPGVDTRRDRMHQDVMRVYREATGGGQSWAAADSYFRGRAVAYWREDPARAAGLALRKCYLFLASRNYADIYSPAAELAAGLNGALRLTPIAIPWLIGPALVGLALMARRPLRFLPELMLFILPFAVVAVFWYSPRYRVPAVPMIVVAAAWALARLGEWRAHRWESLTTLVALSLALAIGPINRARAVDVLDASTVRFNLAYALHELGRAPEAIEQLKLGLQLNPRADEKRAALADLLVQAGRADEALEVLAIARTESPGDFGMRLKSARALLQARRFAQAETLLKTLLDERPDDASVLIGLAEACRLSGQTQRAADYCERALAAMPDRTELRLNYAELLGELNRPDEARRQVKIVIEQAPSSADAHRRLGMIEARVGNMAAAGASFAESLRLDPRDIRTLYDLASLEAQQGRLESAAELLRRALAINPKDAQCQAALRRIEDARRRP